MLNTHAETVQKHADQLTSIVKTEVRQHISGDPAGVPTVMGDLFPREVENGLAVILADLKSQAMPVLEAYARKRRKIEALGDQIEAELDQIKVVRLTAPDPADISARQKRIKTLRTLAHKLRRKSFQWGGGCASASLIDLVVCVAIYNALDTGGGTVTTLMSWGAGLASMLLLGVGADWGILRPLHAARENQDRSGLEKKLSLVAFIELLIVSFGLALLRTNTMGVEGAMAWVVWVVTALGLPIIALGGAYCFKTVIAIEAERRGVVEEMGLHAAELGGLQPFGSKEPFGSKAKEPSLARLEKELEKAQRELGEFMEEQVDHLMTSAVRQSLRALAETWAASERNTADAPRAGVGLNRKRPGTEANHD